MEITTLGTLTAAPNADHGFDADMFQRFLSFDVGEGSPVYWHSIGKLYRQPKGEIIAGVEALVSNRLVRQDDSSAEAICRTLLLYRDPKSGDILQDKDGTHIIREYPYIIARFKLQERHLVIHTEGLSGPHRDGSFGLAKISNDKVFAHRAAGSYFFYWTLFGEVETPIGQVWFTETYNASTPPDVMVMNRFGTLPAFAGMGDGLVQSVARRYDDYNQLPAAIRDYVSKHAPDHVEPPSNLAAIPAIKARYLEAAPPSSPQSTPPTALTTQQIHSVVNEYFSALRNMEVDRLLELFTEDAISWDPVGSPPMQVRNKSTNYFHALANIFQKMALTEDDIFVSGQEAAVRWQGLAILRSKPVEVTFEGISVFEIHPDGRIQTVRSYWDKAGLMNRLK